MSKERERGCVNRKRERDFGREECVNGERELGRKGMSDWGEKVGESGSVRVWMSELQLGREAGE